MSRTPTWDEVLDRFEVCLVDQRDALAAGAPDRAIAFVPPPGIGPLPVRLQERARELLGQSEAVCEQIRTGLDERRRDLQLVRRLAGATGPAGGATYVDHAL